MGCMTLRVREEKREEEVGGERCVRAIEKESAGDDEIAQEGKKGEREGGGGAL